MDNAEPKKFTPTPRPVEGKDYYVEHGIWVFTAAYHMKRGKCCESACRHCPYGYSDKKEESGRRDSNPHEG